MSKIEKGSILDKIIGFVAMVWLRYIKPSWSHFRWRDRLAGDTLPVPKNIITRASIWCTQMMKRINVYKILYTHQKSMHRRGSLLTNR